jgi:putative CRISPR-associated protein (TIGR02620 family)
METVIVTRHPALVELLIERGIIAEADRARVIEHATVADVRGRRVIGVLPLHLACEAARVVEIPLAVRPDQRGRELSLDELREIAGPETEYSVCRVSDVDLSDLDAMETSRTFGWRRRSG